MTKEIKKRLTKDCAICGTCMKVIIYNDKTYRGGHFFGKIPLHTDEAWKKALKSGYTEKKIGTIMVRVMKKDPVAYRHTEYWECPKCYWKG